MSEGNEVLARVLGEIEAAKAADTVRASHSSYVTGVFEQAASDNQVLARVLGEIEAAKAADTVRASHSSYVTGVFES